MERFTEYHNGVAVIKDKSKHKEAMEKLARYEELAEQGLLLKLPCKVGDKIYQIEDEYIYEFNAKEIEIRMEDGEYIFCIDWMDYKVDDFGKTVFLTKAEAEKALKEMKGESNNG